MSRSRCSIGRFRGGYSRPMEGRNAGVEPQTLSKIDLSTRFYEKPRIRRTPSLFMRLRIYFGVNEAPSRSAAPRRDVHPLTGKAKVHIHQKEQVVDVNTNDHTLCRSEKSYRARKVNSSTTSQ